MQLIIHPTDFEERSAPAFVHALAMALVHQCDLTLLHAGRPKNDDMPWEGFPQVRPTLRRWGLLDNLAGREEVRKQLGVNVRKVLARGSSAAETILDHVDRLEPDLLVLSSRGDAGPPEWWKSSVSRPVARQSPIPTLVVPSGHEGFVAYADGALTLDRILAPVDRDPDPIFPLQTAASIMRSMTAEATVELLHVGDSGSAPDVPDETLPRATLTRSFAEGDPAEAIVARADEMNADLIVMATKGRQGLMDALRGSVTEQVLSKTLKPVLVVPAAFDEE